MTTDSSSSPETKASPFSPESLREVGDRTTAGGLRMRLPMSRARPSQGAASTAEGEIFPASRETLPRR